MEVSTQSLFANYVVEKKDAPQSYRAEMIGKFHERLQKEYHVFSGKELSARTVAIKLAFVKTDELEFFYKQCQQARSFSKFFWWSLNPKNAKRTM